MGDFKKILDSGAKVDDMFKDSPLPKGSNPFEQGEVKLDVSKESLGESDDLFCVSRKLSAVESLFRLVTKESSFGELTSDILRVAMEYVSSEAGTFFEVDYQNQCMFFRAVTGRSSEQLLSVTVPMGTGVVGFVCENQQPIALSTVEDNPMYLKSISDMVGFDTRNIIAFPVIIRGVTFGCIELLNRIGEAQYTDADKEVLTTICTYASKVIENRLLLASVTKQLKAKNEAA